MNDDDKNNQQLEQPQTSPVENQPPTSTGVQNTMQQTPQPIAQPAAIPPTTQKSNSKKQKLVFVVSFVVLLLAFAGARAITSSQQNKSAEGIKTLLTSDKTEPYVSSEHGFSADFPGFPTTEHSDLDINGVAVPYTQYTKETDNGQKAYMIQVVKYPTDKFTVVGQERGALDGSINGMARGSQGTLVTSSNDGTFLGYPSATATFRITEDNVTYELHTLSFVKENGLYTIMTVGETKMAFDAFVSSFKMN